MIVVTLVCVVLGGVMGRIEYLRRWAVFHEQIAAETEPLTMNSIFHNALAYHYRNAMWHPWTIVDDPFGQPVPNSSAPAPNPPNK